MHHFLARGSWWLRALKYYGPVTQKAWTGPHSSRVTIPGFSFTCAAVNIGGYLGLASLSFFAWKKYET